MISSFGHLHAKPRFPPLHCFIRRIMPPAFSGKLKTEGDLQRADVFLENNSYISGGSHVADKDFQLFSELKVVPDPERYKHLVRWWRHIRVLRQRYPHGAPTFIDPASTAVAATDAKAAAEKPRARKELVIDSTVVPWEDRVKPTNNPLPLGAGAGPVRKDGRGEKFYLTTAISYTNGYPHIGHAYEATVADIVSRYHRMFGRDVFFMTGTDEHGQKIAEAAETKGLEPINLCDIFVDAFKALNQRLIISEQRFIRTTDPDHIKTAQELWGRCRSNGDIYLGKYEGWYLIREERFVTDQEAQEWNYKDPGTGKDLTKMCEPSFFFKMSRYQQMLLDHIESNPAFIQPESYRSNILTRLRSEDLRDLSISRGNFTWGIPCPEDPVNGNDHVMYVWFDALTNYVSGVNAFNSTDPLSRFWPADVHLIGKDITWFHSVIWPTMLMSAGLPLPRCIAVHGFLQGADGRKMSKTYGNTVNPHDVLDGFPADTFRWYVSREVSFGGDIKFSCSSMTLMHNSDLCNNLGNLVQRAVHLSGGSVQECDVSQIEKPFDLAKLRADIEEAFSSIQLSVAAELVIGACSATNRWIADSEPWKMKAEDQQAKRTAVIRVLVEAVYALAHFFAPFMPVATQAIFDKFGVGPIAIADLSTDFLNLKPGTPVISNSVLFALMKVEEADPAPAANPNPPNPFSLMDVRVGEVKRVWNHPDADRLFCEEIDIGGEIRNVVSGLREHYTLEEMQGRRLLVVCNMVPVKLVGVTSQGMVLAAKNLEEGKVELVDPPKSANVGDRILPQGVEATCMPLKAEKVKKQKVWDAVAKELKTDGTRIACFAGTQLQTPAGDSCVAPTLVGAVMN